MSIRHKYIKNFIQIKQIGRTIIFGVTIPLTSKMMAMPLIVSIQMSGYQYPDNSTAK